jgi:hypothetical protein
MVEVAQLSVNETQERADAKAKQIGYEADAVKSTIQDVVKYQADAFKIMETDL